jgi:hypothetical protein
MWNTNCVWEVSVLDEFKAWYETLTSEEQSQIREKVDLLASFGPSLRRPAVAEIATSAYKNMKELRASAGRAQLRVLFVFDPQREALLILGGDKAVDSQWNDWYQTNIPIADALYGEYLKQTSQTDKGAS